MHLLFTLLATGARGAERAVRIWNVQARGIVDCMEFDTSGTSDTCVKYFWVWVKFSRINTKICDLPNSGYSFHKKNRSDFVFE